MNSPGFGRGCLFLRTQIAADGVFCSSRRAHEKPRGSGPFEYRCERISIGSLGTSAEDRAVCNRFRVACGFLRISDGTSADGHGARDQSGRRLESGDSIAPSHFNPHDLAFLSRGAAVVISPARSVAQCRERRRKKKRVPKGRLTALAGTCCLPHQIEPGAAAGCKIDA